MAMDTAEPVLDWQFLSRTESSGLDKNKKILQILIKDKSYTKLNGAYCFLNRNEFLGHTADSSCLGWIQNKIKLSGKLYYLLLKIFGPVVSSANFRKCCNKYLGKYTEKAVIVNIGSGPRLFYDRSDIINIDIFPFDEVDIVANAFDLPIENETVDCIFNMGMLEHVSNPEIIVREMYRIIKPGGTITAAIPFMQPFHAAPQDYYRWTPNGLQTLFSPFDKVEIGIAAGPTSGMLWVVDEWLAILFSFGSKALHDLWFLIFMILFFPLKYLDFIMERFPFASNCASSFYVIAHKKKIIQEQNKVSDQ